jgi:hypothetical protein
MIISILILATVPFLDSTNWDRHPVLRNTESFKESWMTNSDRQFGIGGSLTESSVFIDVSSRLSSKVNVTEHGNNPGGKAQFIPLTTIVPNYGIRSGYVHEPGTLECFIGTEGFIARAFLGAPTKPTTEFGKIGPRPENWDMTEFVPLATEILQYQLSAFIGSKSVHSASQLIGSTAVAVRKVERTGDEYIKAQDLADLMQFQLISSKNQTYFEFRHPAGPTIRFYAASNYIHVGDKTININTPVMLHQGQPWIPTTFINHLK